MRADLFTRTEHENVPPSSFRKFYFYPTGKSERYVLPI